MRTMMLAALALLATAGAASAQDRPRLFGPRRVVDSPSQNTLYLPPPRFPRLAAVAQPQGPFDRPGYVLPGVYNNRPLARVIPLAIQSTLFVFSFLDPISLYTIGNAAPPAIRLLHVALNGSPTPGQPGQTILFVANPFAAEARARLSQGQPLIGGRAQGWVAASTGGTAGYAGSYQVVGGGCGCGGP